MILNREKMGFDELLETLVDLVQGPRSPKATSGMGVGERFSEKTVTISL
jgi:hypothetical protein